MAHTPLWSETLLKVRAETIRKIRASLDDTQVFAVALEIFRKEPAPSGLPLEMEDNHLANRDEFQMARFLQILENCHLLNGEYGSPECNQVLLGEDGQAALFRRPSP